MLLHAPSIVSKALLSVLEMPIILGASPRSTVLRDAFTPWVSRVASNINFANSLVEELGTREFGLHTLQAKTSTSKYKRMWASYHSFSTGSNLMEIWSAALETPSNAPYFPLFVQLATRKVMEGAVLIVFPKQEHRDADSSQPVLKADDEQAVRYVAGYVVLSLTKKYEKRANDSTALNYLNCLGRMSENTSEGEPPTFLDYTKLWLEQINRGGLFKVNNYVFLLFQAMEVAVCRVLTTLNVSANPTISVKKYTKAAILRDPASLAHWSQILSSCPAMNSSESDDLLDEISDKWATIRGHSFAAGYIEQYQRAKSESNKQKALRKSLKSHASV